MKFLNKAELIKIEEWSALNLEAAVELDWAEPSWYILTTNGLYGLLEPNGDMTIDGAIEPTTSPD